MMCDNVVGTIDVDDVDDADDVDDVLDDVATMWRRCATM